MVDTHAHLVLCDPEPAVETVASARDSGVGRVLSVGLDHETNLQTVELANEIPGVFACVGRHPNQATGFDQTTVAELRAMCAEECVVAVGETGLDLYRAGATIDDQRAAFSAQIALAVEFALPVVIHLRDEEGSELATREAFETLEREAAATKVLIHCFSADAEWARRAADNGWYCSFAGNLTYPSAGSLREAARAVPDHLVLVETDSPFLAPQPMRGEPNRPVNVVETAKVLASERGVAYEDLEQRIDSNAAELFGW